METMTLQALSSRIDDNDKQNRQAMKTFKEQLSKQKGLHRGRVRQRNTIEQKILSRFGLK